MGTDEVESYTDETNYYTVIEGDKLFIEIPVFVGGDVIGVKKQLVMTKEIFRTCYQKWILGEEESNV